MKNSIPSPELQKLESGELLDLMVSMSKKLIIRAEKGADHSEINDLQIQIATIKDEIYRKGNLSPESMVSNNFFYLSIIDRS
jgi:hypothetical protein